jgi:membrane fusion protein
MTIASILIAAAAFALVAFGSYARRVDLQGTILPNTGLISIGAPAAGWVRSLAVTDGDFVEQGAPLYTVDVDIATQAGGVQELVNKVLVDKRKMLVEQIDRKTNMSNETKTQLEQKISNLISQNTLLGEQLAVQQEFLKILEYEYNLFRGLVGRQQASLNELDTRQQSWMQAQTKIQDLDRNRARLTGELNDARYQLATLAITTHDEIDALKARIFEIDEKLASGEAHRSVVIPSPATGKVTAITARPGQLVGAGAPMLKIIPEHTSMQAHLLAPSSAIGFVRQGNRVLLRYSAFPYQKFGEFPGAVTMVSDAALSADEVQSLLAGATPANQTAPLYRVVVEPENQVLNILGEGQRLPASMQVQAYVLLDRRPLYQWIFQPLSDLVRATHGS